LACFLPRPKYRFRKMARFRSDVDIRAQDRVLRAVLYRDLTSDLSKCSLLANSQGPDISENPIQHSRTYFALANPLANVCTLQ